MQRCWLKEWSNQSLLPQWTCLWLNLGPWVLSASLFPSSLALLSSWPLPQTQGKKGRDLTIPTDENASWKRVLLRLDCRITWLSTRAAQLDSLMVEIFRNPVLLIKVKNVVWPSNYHPIQSHWHFAHEFLVFSLGNTSCICQNVIKGFNAPHDTFGTKDRN